ncbi:hypothetical protein D3C85_1237330 [compost metagenome]
MVVFGVALHQALEHHVAHATQDELIEVTREHELGASRDGGNGLVDDVLVLQQACRRPCVQARNPQRAAVAVFHFFQGLQRGVVERQAELGRVAIRRIDGVNQTVHLLPGERARGSGLFPDRGGRGQALGLGGCAGARTHDDQAGFGATDTGSDAARQIGFHVDARVREQFIRHTDNLGGQLVGA